MFDWDTPKKELNEQDVLTLLTSKFAMRLNMERKRIEHVTLVPAYSQENEEPPNKKPNQNTGLQDIFPQDTSSYVGHFGSK